MGENGPSRYSRANAWTSHYTTSHIVYRQLLGFITFLVHMISPPELPARLHFFITLHVHTQMAISFEPESQLARHRIGASMMKSLEKATPVLLI